MGFVPIFVTLGGFIFLFFMVVNKSITRKKLQYKSTLESLSQTLGSSDNTLNLDAISKSLASHPQSSTETQHLHGKAKLYRHQYNQLIETMPYKIVAKIAGHELI
ncbi:hypothetical protein GCM10007049_19820 [Echinicola pacifica]|uniref:Uncharacterized protein n=1 Tax=Echinicola pacifica TaxID=346377 RepID=A0A918Q0D9_9BACT|nr:hypothetical protein [Echinicola pacifica]GGZ27083.1 hypothetical protein GCM10007049_19820 [Echinicola pacifica]